MSIPSIVYKAHATGNDFVVYLDEDGTHEPTADEVRFLCDRHFGIGGDGLIRLAHPQAVSDVNERQIADCAAGDADWFMDYRNADGSLAEMCGNGTRAITLFAQRQGIADQPGGKPFHLAPRRREDPDFARRCAGPWQGRCSKWRWAHGSVATSTVTK